MVLLEGKTPAALLRQNLKERTAYLRQMGHTPRLAAVLAGDDPASALYLKRKQRMGRELGILVDGYHLPNPTNEEVYRLLRQLSRREDVDGILLEQPLPRHLNKEMLLSAIAPEKDVDGLNPATPRAVMRLLNHYQIPLKGAEVVIIGHSTVVGRPLAMLMLQADATVTVCHKATRDLKAHTSRADIVVVAAGVPGLVTGEMLRPGAVVVDVGINVVDGKTVGDVDFESASRVAGAISPVPGGVGPLTTLTILESTVANAERQLRHRESAAD
ncbi:MAG TPA: bifunctional 5,10-methylenetetrahydrofolate dehydrogenase/5,10-methenyltetrahydrofolate cyclohydrolase [Symbiobacteriaceae bacterium]